MNKNQKGFTLVELIVVMALMAIIMGAVMAIMSPTAKFHNKVENTTNQEAVCIAVGDSISDQIKYARSVQIISLPAGIDLEKKDIPENVTNYIKINNQNRRPTSKKGAFGLFSKGEIDSSKDFKNDTVIMGESFYGEDSFKITISEYGNTDNRNFIMLNFEGCPMKYESGSYTKNEDIVYNYSKSIDFTNINNKSMLKNSDGSLSVTNTGDDVIYILYVKPINAVTPPTTTTSSSATTTSSSTTTTTSTSTTTTTSSSTTTTTSVSTTTITSSSTTTTTSGSTTTTSVTGTSSVPARDTFTVHYSSKRASYLWGELDDGYVVNGETWERVRDSQKDYSINPGTTAQIKLSSNWGNVKATDTISYGEVANGIKDI